MADSMNKELFLDILTKEEKEALLTKKMEEIRKKNDALRKRHEEIEADKRVAAKNNPNKDVNSYTRETSSPGSSSPQKESKLLPGEDKRGPRPKTGGRGKSQVGGKSKEKKPQQGVFRVIRWQPQTGEVDITEDDANDGGDEGDGMTRCPPSRFHTDPHEAGQEDGEEAKHEMKTTPAKRNRRPQMTSEDHEEMAERRGRLIPSSRPQRSSSKLGPEDGPPPDPSYNFLADRRREGPAKESNGESPAEKIRKSDTRRHPKNYGGQDFNNVKTQMRTTKERQERPKSGPPRTKMELAMAMTGKERKQYLEWKAERDRVDQERMDRQKSTSGEWRRAWDADKNQQDFEQPSSPQRTEPAKRPGVKQEQDVQNKPVGRGRARGRGRGRGRGDRSPRQRTFSSGDESRKVERQKDLLVVKIDNSGKDTNQSVEVEYWDDDMVDVKSNSAASVKSGTSSRDGHSNHTRCRRRDDHQFDDHDEGQDGDDSCVGGHPHRHTLSHSLGDENEHDESWEDCPEDSEFYADDDYADGDDKYKEPLKLECKLNPDAPEFTPTSPEFMKTPPGHVKVMDWVTEVNSNLSPTSPPPTLDGVNNEECKKALFKDKSNSAGKSSSHGGVTKNDTKVSEEELSASYIDEKESCDTAAPEASEEFLDASGDVGEADISQLSNQEVGHEHESKSSPVGSCGNVEGDADPSTQNTEVSTPHNDKVIDEAQSYSKVNVPNEPQGNNETIVNSDAAVSKMKEVDGNMHSGDDISLIDQPLISGETGISAKAAPMNPTIDAIKVDSTEMDFTADATTLDPTTLVSTADITSVDPTADATSVDPTADATSVDPTADVTLVEQTSDATSVDPTADATAVAPTSDATSVDPTADATSVDPTADVTLVEQTSDATSVDPTADATAVAPTSDATAVDPTADATAVAPTSDATAVVPTADATAVEPTAEIASELSTQQMAKPDMTPLTDRSDQLQTHQLVQEKVPTVDNDQKSSVSETVVAAESKTTIPTTTTATAESSHVE
ncbi:uncharacterized protein LOC124118858 isoform X3 [Haliotis rufescens]|uniref:uncharacterized protein LOC124118858 isoform X3 n=1 Tax=Haliotis rufescens TaxID=6454 RepID=UPI00201F8F3C|nr:uncharacterized protein LOC124118858 isoform X3 [Haliotis rufescens]